jgi:hypothetical protein
LRNEKNTGWEGGYRIPSFARWPGKIKAGTLSKLKYEPGPFGLKVERRSGTGGGPQRIQNHQADVGVNDGGGSRRLNVDLKQKLEKFQLFKI